jgi:hypothetical protein
VLKYVLTCLHLIIASLAVSCLSSISAYTTHREVENQSQAAFAAALMLPSTCRIKKKTNLPAPRLAPPSGSRLQCARPQTTACRRRARE